MTEFLQCGTCNESQGPLDKCDDCKIVRYCSAACKIKHAPIHALACVRAVGAVTAVASTISVDAATAANVNATPTSTIAAANRTAATASAVAATATTASATKATKATTVVTDANTTDYKSDGHSNVHQHNSMPSLSETQKEAHTNAMTQFIGDHWGHLYECYLHHNPFLVLPYLDGHTLIDCKKQCFVHPKDVAEITASNKRPGAASGMFVIDWATKEFQFVPLNHMSKLFTPCMFQHLPPSFHEWQQLWVQVWMDMQDPTCPAPWWNFGFELKVVPTDPGHGGVMTPNLEFTQIAPTDESSASAAPPAPVAPPATAATVAAAPSCPTSTATAGATAAATRTATGREQVPRKSQVV